MDFAGTEINASRRIVEDTNNSKDSCMVACRRRRRRRRLLARRSRTSWRYRYKEVIETIALVAFLGLAWRFQWLSLTQISPFDPERREKMIGETTFIFKIR